jgi:hypothetical protein
MLPCLTTDREGLTAHLRFTTTASATAPATEGRASPRLLGSSS